LTHAVKIQNGAAVAALLEAGADPNFANKKGVTPISAAAHKGNTEIMSSLIDAGSNVNACNSSGSTALIQVKSFLKIIEVLTDFNGNADCMNLGISLRPRSSSSTSC
jgi:ankyrin repeat protein